MAPKTKEKKEGKKPEKSDSIKEGDKVSLDYEGRLETGEVFDSSRHGDHSYSLEFTVGSRQVIPGFEKAVIGMKKGQSKKFEIASKDAYGEMNPALRQEIPRNALPQDQEPKAGMILVMNAPDGRKFPVKISDVKKDSIVLDLNHPLAGKKLLFSIEILNIN